MVSFNVTKHEPEVEGAVRVRNRHVTYCVLSMQLSTYSLRCYSYSHSIEVGSMSLTWNIVFLQAGMDFRRDTFHESMSMKLRPLVVTTCGQYHCEARGNQLAFLAYARAGPDKSDHDGMVAPPCRSAVSAHL